MFVFGDYDIVRQYRNVTYNIHIENNGCGHNGIGKILVDGKEINGNVIPYDKEKKYVNVEVIMNN